MTSIHGNERDGDSETWEEVDEWVSPTERFLDRLAINNDALYRAFRPPYQDQLDALQRVAKLIQPIKEPLSWVSSAVQNPPDYGGVFSTKSDIGGMLQQYDIGGIRQQHEQMQRQHDQFMTALGYIKVRRRRYVQPTSSRPAASPPRSDEARPHEPVLAMPSKGKRGRKPGHCVINAMHFDRLMCAYCIEKSATPSRREFQIFAAKKYKTVDCHTLTMYARNYCKTDWPGVRRQYGQRFGVE